jgi:hypothetical protein
MPRIANPYADLAQARFRLRGNLHAHTTLSDGVLEPQKVIDAYAERAYGFLAISDHDHLADHGALEGWADRGMVLIPANEVTAGGVHIQHVNAAELVAPHPDRQKVIDEIRRTGGFAVVNHPNWQERFDHCPVADLERWRGYAGMEIYNGVIARHPGSSYATGKWDMLLSAGRRVWGFANDDFHKPEDLALGWNVAFCGERSAAAVVDALSRGAFYASTGVVIDDIRVRGSSITVETQGASKIVAFADYGRRIAQRRDAAIAVEVPSGARYVRFECYGCGEEQAWTQPFFVEA